jgi:hypothetical protein
MIRSKDGRFYISSFKVCNRKDDGNEKSPDPFLDVAREEKRAGRREAQTG